MTRTRRRLLLFFVLLVGVALASYRQILVAAAGFLTPHDAAVKCDAAVVLRGEETDGGRLQEAARLYRAGLVRKIVLSGGHFAFGLHETDLSLPRALEMGLPREDLLPVISDTLDSWAEAEVLVPEFQKAGFRCVILISSETDARKLRVTYRKVAPGLKVLIRTVSDSQFSADTWWQAREGRKAFFYGWTSLLRAWSR